MTDESYPAFLHRIHVQDVERGTTRHKPGDCQVCDEKRALLGPGEKDQ